MTQFTNLPINTNKTDKMGPTPILSTFESVKLVNTENYSQQ